jgi:acetoin utilization deacetylase AcuC-like enzyme
MSTAYLHDSRYMDHKTGWGHPERPERLSAIHRALQAAPYYQKLVKISPAMPDIKHIEKIHSPAYIQRVEKEIASGISYLDSMDTAVSRESYEIALLAVGGSLALCDAIVSGKAQNGFAAVRPPGHHAEHDYAAGFCIFNNIAIAAKYLQEKHGLSKIAIVDWDVHHGNGSQHSFERDRSVLYCSLHQQPLYPGTGAATETGTGTGKGYTINIPMRPGSGDEDYRIAFVERIIPAINSFKADIVLISAGFDAHRLDSISSIKLSTEMFAEFTTMLAKAAGTHSGGRMVAFLEGGYHLDALAESVVQMMNVLVSAGE